jgi:phosphonate transport system ATP-binding protein
MADGLTLKGLCKTWADGTRGLADIDLFVPEGQFVAVIGLSGAGKSTLLRCINRLEEPTRGQILLGDDDVTAASKSELRRLRRRIGFVFQQFNLIKPHTVRCNVLNGALGELGALSAMTGSFSAEQRARADEAIAAVGLGGREESTVAAMSGGQQQRVAIARTIMQRPDLVLADEPTASLDPKLSRSILELLRKMNKERKVSVFLNLHEIDLARDYCDRVIALRQGRLIWDGEPAGMTKARLEEIYKLSDLELDAL